MSQVGRNVTGFPKLNKKKELGPPKKWCASGQRLIPSFDQAVILGQRDFLQCVCTPEFSSSSSVALSPLPACVLESLKLWAPVQYQGAEIAFLASLFCSILKGTCKAEQLAWKDKGLLGISRIGIREAEHSALQGRKNQLLQ